MSYECDQCGACCKYPIIEIESIDMDREPKLRAVATPLMYGGGRLACGPQHPCGMLGEDNRCSVYDTRPDVCAQFEPGSNQCQEWRGRVGLAPLVETVYLKAITAKEVGR